MKKPIVLNKFRLGERSERVAALADEWGCSITVATTRLIDAGLAAVDRDEALTPEAIRAGFSELDKLSIDDWVATICPSDEPRPESTSELPDTDGKRMFDEAARHQGITPCGGCGATSAVPGANGYLKECV